ncbi:MAG: hypothetical protein JST16_06665 [Bdellovibrionales bacterium]|nr:hypothetical protein [Bdellovibrionales bacterium]
MKNFTFKALLAALAVSSLVKVGVPFTQGNRAPSSVDESYELTISSLALDVNSRVPAMENVFLRTTFAKNRTVEFGRNERWKVARGESRPLAIKLDIERNWIQADDTMEFRVEVVESGAFDTVMLRCTQVAREVSQVNRSYQCSIPGENTPVLSYRLAKKGAAPVSVAQK